MFKASYSSSQLERGRTMLRRVIQVKMSKSPSTNAQWDWIEVEENKHVQLPYIVFKIATQLSFLILKLETLQSKSPSTNAQLDWIEVAETNMYSCLA